MNNIQVRLAIRLDLLHFTFYNVELFLTELYNDTKLWYVQTIPEAADDA